MAVARLGVRLQAILVMSLFLLQLPSLPCTLATVSEIKPVEALLMSREPHHEGHLDLLATTRSTRSRRILNNGGPGAIHNPACC
uniref:Secreted protein n=1 Tax=Leersia perrieri TaxID=77586 RepID=A0A0D9VDR5_9ORYZ